MFFVYFMHEGVEKFNVSMMRSNQHLTLNHA